MKYEYHDSLYAAVARRDFLKANGWSAYCLESRKGYIELRYWK